MSERAERAWTEWMPLTRSRHGADDAVIALEEETDVEFICSDGSVQSATLPAGETAVYGKAAFRAALAPPEPEQPKNLFVGPGLMPEPAPMSGEGLRRAVEEAGFGEPEQGTEDADLDEIQARIEKAHETVTKLCSGEERWTMRIPADEERDSDLIIGAALRDALKLVARLRTQGEAREVSASVVDWVRRLVNDWQQDPHQTISDEGVREFLRTLDELRGEPGRQEPVGNVRRVQIAEIIRDAVVHCDADDPDVYPYADAVRCLYAAPVPGGTSRMERSTSTPTLVLQDGSGTSTGTAPMSERAGRIGFVVVGKLDAETEWSLLSREIETQAAAEAAANNMAHLFDEIAAMPVGASHGEPTPEDVRIPLREVLRTLDALAPSDGDTP